jgi:hypothetical protein
VRPLISLVAIVSALALAGTATAATRTLTVDRGVVQSVSSTLIVLRELDGSTVALQVGARTRVLLNGQPATLTDIRPGFVAAVTHNGSAPARVVRAFGRVTPTVDSGVVVSVSRRVLVIRKPDGATLTFQVTARTKIRWRGLPATIAAVRPGRLVQVTYTQGGAAIRIAVRAHRAV